MRTTIAVEATHDRSPSRGFTRVPIRLPPVAPFALDRKGVRRSEFIPDVDVEPGEPLVAYGQLGTIGTLSA